MYESYRKYKTIEESVEELLKASGVDLTNGGDIPELQQFQTYLSDNKNIVYNGLKPENLMYS
jgi:hypothetical protein